MLGKNIQLDLDITLKDIIYVLSLLILLIQLKFLEVFVHLCDAIYALQRTRRKGATCTGKYFSMKGSLVLRDGKYAPHCKTLNIQGVVSAPPPLLCLSASIRKVQKKNYSQGQAAAKTNTGRVLNRKK